MRRKFVASGGAQVPPLVLLNLEIQCEHCFQHVESPVYNTDTEKVEGMCANGHQSSIEGNWENLLSIPGVVMADAKSEKAELKIIGATPQRNSGRNAWEKGDGIVHPFVVDVKEAKSSFTFNKKVWAKICSDAARHGKEPALMIALGENRNTVRTWIIGDTIFKEMLAAWNSMHGDNDG